MDGADCSWVLMTIMNLVKRVLRASRSKVVLLPSLWMGLRLAETQFAAAMFGQGLPSRAEGPISEGPLHFVFTTQLGGF